MSRRARLVCEALLLAGGIGCALSLLLPWLHLSGRDRSTIDIIGSATALELLDGTTKWLVVGLWMSVPLAVAAGLMLWALHRHRASRRLIVLASLLIAMCCLITIWRLGSVMELGWYVGLLCAAASVGAAVALGRAERSEPIPSPLPGRD
jgi:Ni/Fe-hydrogenase subunit HybB-like protein